jgi:phenylalanyl-tRNA synthetase beta chain
MRVSLEWLKDYVDIRISPEEIAEKLTMAGLEVTSKTKLDQDIIMEIEVTPNRADCLSIVGVAREIAAVTGKKLKLPQLPSLRGRGQATIPIQVQDKLLCPRYLGRAIKNIEVGPSPEWLIHRLEVMGIRAVNNIVDITNFCLLEFGQPLHSFDLDKLQGQKIVVRRALPKEEIITIDGVKRQLEPDMLVIADKVSPQAIAGIMGGKDSEVVDGVTTNILLESAYFDPLNVHNTSRKLGLATHSSYRFERGVDLEGVFLSSLRATELITKLARPSHKAVSRGGRKRSRISIVGRLIDKGKKPGEPGRVSLNYSRVGRVLGVDVSPVQIKEILAGLQFSIVQSSKEGLTVKVPSFRPDISREADLVEEVVRLYGYDKIPLRVSQLVPNLSSAGSLELFSEETYNVARQILSSFRLNEIMTYSLISRQALRKLWGHCENLITVKNPLSYEQEILRPTLLVGMLNALLINVNRKNADLKLFELSRIYRKGNSGATEELTNLSIGVTGKRGSNWMAKSGEYSFFDLKGIVQSLLNGLGVKRYRFLESEAVKLTPETLRAAGIVEPASVFVPGRCALLVLEPAEGKHRGGHKEDIFGVFGEVRREILERFDISSPVYAGELQLNKLLAYIHPEKKFVPLPRFPSVERDISLIVPQEVRSEEIEALISEIGRELVVKVALVDQYFGEQIPSGFRGLTYSIEYNSVERTLTAAEVDKLHTQVCQALTKEMKVQFR